MQRDPVCNAEVDPTQDRHSEYHGKIYYFCSLRCKQAFEDHPPTYTAHEAPPNRSGKALDAVAQTWIMVGATDAMAGPIL